MDGFDVLPVVGMRESFASVLSARCYADTFAKRVGKGGLWEPGGVRKIASESYWRKPLGWNLIAEKAGVPMKVFCASMCDVFEDHPALGAPRDLVFELIDATPWLVWQLLTKRPENIARMIPERWDGAAPGNVWLGTSVENARFSHRALELVEVDAPVHFLSCEPLLGSLFPPQRRWCKTCGGAGSVSDPGCPGLYAEGCCGICEPFVCIDGAHPLLLHHIEWVIVGGESGPGFRPMNLDHARELRDACGKRGIPFFFKQHGGLRPKSGGKLLDGREWCEFPRADAPVFA